MPARNRLKFSHDRPRILFMSDRLSGQNLNGEIVSIQTWRNFPHRSRRIVTPSCGLSFLSFRRRVVFSEAGLRVISGLLTSWRWLAISR
jgi:hypothetical protein